MKIYHPNLSSQHWDFLSKWISEYYYDECQNSCILLGNLIYYDIEEYKKTHKDLKIVIYQLEPLHKKHWIYTNGPSKDHFIKSIKLADEVWDYDLDNIKTLKKLYNIDAKFMPLGYTESLRKISNVENPEIDVLFYGALSQHRSEILFNAFEKGVFDSDEEAEEFSNVKFVNLHGLYGDELDDYISRSKIVLNICPYKNGIQAQTRIFYLLANNKCVLSEKCNRNYYGDLITEFSDAQDLLNKIRYLLKDDRWRSFTESNPPAFKYYTEYKMKDKKKFSLSIKSNKFKQ
jgi:hypothetical protein